MIRPAPILVLKALAVLAAAAALASGLFLLACQAGHSAAAPAAATPKTPAGPPARPPEVAITLTRNQLAAVKVEPVGTYGFPTEKETIGTIDFDGDLSVQVFPPYPGTLIGILADLDAPVARDQPLYTIRSPDLLAAESALIGAQAVFDLTSRELARARALNGTQGVSQRELEQAVSDQQAAEGALRAARDAVRIYGRTEAEVDQMLATRRTDPALVVRSPIQGRVTARNAQPGAFVQPGTAPAPCAVADVTAKWMLASVNESDLALFHPGQPVSVEVPAYPGRVFRGRVGKVYESVDPNTHRVTVRSEIRDPANELRPGMLGRFTIRVAEPARHTAVPANAVVREADGTMTAWVTLDGQRFVQRVITTGLRRDDRVEVLAGLAPEERIVTDNTIFISNILNANAAD